MSLKAWTLTACLLMAASQARAAAPEFPKAFQGDWSHNLAGCGSVDDDSFLIIERGKASFYEREGQLKRLTSPGPSAIKADLAMRGEGETWTDAFSYQLSADGKTLTEVVNGQRSVRVRCPGKHAITR